MGMITKKIGLIFTLLMLLVLAGFAIRSMGGTVRNAELVQGEWQGAAYEETGGKVLRLSGEWMLVPGKGLESVYGESSPSTRVNVGLSSLWSGSRGAGLSPVYGSAVYTSRLTTRGMKGTAAFRVPRILSSYRLFVNGREILRSGLPGDSRKTETPSGQPAVVVFEQTRDVLDIELQVSNYHSFSGGFYHGSLEYGSLENILLRDSVLRSSGLVVLFLMFAFAGLCFMQFYHHHLYEDYHFYLAMGVVVFALQLLVSEFFQFKTFQNLISWTLAQKLRLILSFLLVPFLINYTRKFLAGTIRVRYVSHISLGLALAASIAASLIPAWVLPLLAFAGPAVLVGGMIFILYINIRGIHRHIRLSPLFLAGNLILLAGAVHDLLFFLGIIPSSEFLWVGMSLYFIVALLMIIIKEGRFLEKTGTLKDTLEKAVEGRNSLLVNISREVGGSLDKVNELIRSLIQGALGPMNSEQLLTSSMVLSSTMHHQHLINDTIDFLRMQEDDIVVNKTSVNLSSLILLHVNSFQPVIMGLSVNLKNSVSRELPYVYADGQRLGQIFYTFLLFGIQNIREGQIQISAEQEGDVIRMEIALKGVQFTDRLEELLAILSQEISPKEIQERELTVLRFFLSRNFIRQHGSELQILRDSMDKLSFRFSLPVYNHEGEAVDDAISEEMAIHLDALENLQPLLDEIPSEREVTILVATGDPVNLQVMKSQLASMNYRIIPVIKGVSVLERTAAECPDMVIMDSSLSDMTCYDVCRELREQYTANQLPVIMIIEEKQSSDVMETLTSGANDYLRRPYQQEEFLTRVNTHLQLSRINSIYSQFVPKEFLKCLGQENITDLKLGDQVQREMTVLFVDIRAFTNLSENMTPQENFKFINSYLSQFTPIITRNNGFVDKFIGDAIMALYPDRPEDAIRTAIEMNEYVKIYNGYRAKCGYNPIDIGIGIHTGNLILGIIGDSQRMQGTVISDAVNLASRIQDVTKLYKANVVISQETFVQLDNPMEFNFRFLGKVKVKGKDKSVALFEIFNSDDEGTKKLKEDTKNEFEMAILLFAKRDFSAARDLFQKVLTENPDDKTAILFLDRAKKFLATEKRSFLTSL